MPHHNDLHYSVSTPRLGVLCMIGHNHNQILKSTQENEDVDIDEMIRNYRDKKKRPAKSTK
jgi:hypothetical protein